MLICCYLIRHVFQYIISAKEKQGFNLKITNQNIQNLKGLEIDSCPLTRWLIWSTVPSDYYPRSVSLSPSPLHLPLSPALGWANSAVTLLSTLLHFVCACGAWCACTRAPPSSRLFLAPITSKVFPFLSLPRFGFVSLTNCEILFRFLYSPLTVCVQLCACVENYCCCVFTVRNNRSITVRAPFCPCCYCYWLCFCLRVCACVGEWCAHMEYQQ